MSSSDAALAYSLNVILFHIQLLEKKNLLFSCLQRQRSTALFQGAGPREGQHQEIPQEQGGATAGGRGGTEVKPKLKIKQYTL